MVQKNYIQVDPEVLRADFDRLPFQFKHDLSAHPLLQLEALFDLATRLPPAEVLHWSGAIGIGDNIDTASKTHSTGRSLRETFDHIEDARSYVLIRNAQLDPTFKRLADDILNEIEEASADIEPG